ncbi:brachyurin-like [Leguminivora glycinivorella]|uniref:brachyurin-like n=1 Tax=Leguminivora glycinivorella TaxID=1035111 RepID=UPI00200F53E4|nr:brachyurin-like [Leguminivora glycinivorella]
MLKQLVLLTLPVTLYAWQLCHGDSCKINRQARIIGGDITEQNSRPFQVALYARVGTTGEVGFCGGSLVHPEWVLTAAHCCYHNGQQVDNVQAILGAHSLYDRYENGRRIVNVDEVRVHPDYDPESFANDIALMRLANTMQLTETIDVVRLPYLGITNFNFAGMGATVSGWGIAAPGVEFVSPTLREKLMTVMTDTMCNIQYFDQLPANVVCGFHATAGTCKGDNGGPLTIWYNATEEVILIGVASFVDASGCNGELPSVFTRVQRHLQWISDNTGIVLQ